MPYTTVTAGTTITASWSNANNRDQVVTPFASASARTSAVTSPVEGMLSYLVDSDRYEWYNGTAWRLMPGTFVDETTKTAATTSTGTETFHQSITFTATGQAYRVRYEGAAESTNAGDSIQIRLRYEAGATVGSGGTQIRTRQIVADSASRANQIALSGRFTPAAGQTTVGVSVVLQSGAGTAKINGSAIEESYLYLEAS